MKTGIQEIKKLLESDNLHGKRIVFTNGCFDLLHRGHVEFLAAAKAEGDFLIVGLNSDSSVRRLKGEGRPINNESDRAAVLSALKPVDFVVIFDEDTPYELIKAVMPDVLAKGGDYAIDEIVGADIVRNNGGFVKVIPYIGGCSTTEIIERIRRSR